MAAGLLEPHVHIWRRGDKAPNVSPLVLIAMKTVLGSPLRGFMLVVAGRGGGIQPALYSHMIFLEGGGGGWWGESLRCVPRM